MSAQVEQLYGLRGASLEAFRKAGEVIDGYMRPLFDVRAETQLRQVRALLRYAVDVAPIDEETAESFVARAGNRLALAVHIAEAA